MAENDVNVLVAIDFGGISSSISIATTNEPSKTHTVNFWAENSQDIGPNQFLTSILYTSDGDIICGLPNTVNDKAKRAEGDVYIDNIKQYISKTKDANEKLGHMMEGLTIQKVVTDFLQAFFEKAVECIQSQFNIDLKPECVQSYILACPSSQNKFMAECFVEAGIIEKEDVENKLVFVTEAEATAYHCISLDRQITKIVPDETYYVCDIGHSTFGMSKIEANSTIQFSKVDKISEDLEQGSINLELNFRNYLEINESKLNLNQAIIEVLVEEFNEDLKFKFGVSQVEKEITNDNEIDTEYENLNNNNDEDKKLPGESDNESDDFTEDENSESEDDNDDQEYDNNEEEEEEEEELHKTLIFSAKEKTTDNIRDLEVGSGEEEHVHVFKIKSANGNDIRVSYSDLEEHVFLPYVTHIIGLLLNIEKVKIFLSGRFSSVSYFYDKLITAENGKLLYFVSLIEDTNVDAVSLGALAFGLLNVKNVQSPFFIESSTDTQIEPEIKRPNDTEIDYEYLVGIDFGTTFTGCSYVNRKKPDEKIKTIETGWPGGNAITFGKTPTLLMYDRKMKVKHWGQDAKINMNHNRNLLLLSNFKLFLSPEAVEKQYGKGNKEIAKMKEENCYENIQNNDLDIKSTDENQTPYKLKNQKDSSSVNAVDVISDYLKAVKHHVVKYILATESTRNGFFKSLFAKKCSFQFVLTVPAMWTSSARETMAKAAIKAEIIKENELDQLLMISEPEAAALFCENKYSDLIKDPENPKAETNFVVCDAGGGTVDLVTFALKFDEDDNPMICQIGDSSGDICGSTYLDKAFKKYLIQFYKDMGLEYANINFNSTMDHFIESEKRHFMPDTSIDQYYTVKLPTECRILSVPSDNIKARKYQLIEGNTKLKIRHEDIKEIIFDPIIEKILALIEKQVEQAKNNGRKIDTILLVGGFSRNLYLQQCVKDHFRNVCKVGIPEEGVAAISHGAVSYGLKPRLISKRMVAQSIAIEVQAPFDKSRNDPFDKRVYGPDGEEYSENRLEYFVERSQVLEGKNQELCRKTISVEYPNSALIAIFSCDFKREDKQNLWRYVSNMHSKILEEAIEFPIIDENLRGERIQFEVSCQLDAIGVTIIIECKDSRINNMIHQAGIKTSPDGTWKIARKCKLVVVQNRKPLIEFSLRDHSYALSSS